MATNNKINGIPAPLDTDVVDSADIRGIASAVSANKDGIAKLNNSIYMESLQPEEVKWFKLPPNTIMRATFHANNFTIACDVIAVRTASDGVKFTTVYGHQAFTVRENSDTQYFGIVCQYYARGLIQMFTA